jgi:hypothetical protein
MGTPEIMAGTSEIAGTRTPEIACTTVPDLKFEISNLKYLAHLASGSGTST